MPTHFHHSRGMDVESKLSTFFGQLGHEYKCTDAPGVHGGLQLFREVKKDGEVYAVEVKHLSEGRADRVIPLLSQAILQSQHHARALNMKPMAVLFVENASQSMMKNVKAFIDTYKPDAAIAIVTDDGMNLLRWKKNGPDEVNTQVSEAPRRWASHQGTGSTTLSKPFNLFSDLNQWMLKLLLAPDISEDLLKAPRQRYHSGTELATAANCSQMSASRLLQHLRQQGFLDAYAGEIRVVRRDELFKRWRAASVRISPEMPMRFNVRVALQGQLKAVLASGAEVTCLGLFSAAEALGMGHVSGVPPYVYVPKLPSFSINRESTAWPSVTAYPEGAPDFIVRQAMAPQSTFNGAVLQGDALCSDVIQVWLDVSNHPSRGKEQADHIFEKVLQPLISKGNE